MFEFLSRMDHSYILAVLMEHLNYLIMLLINF